MYADVAFYCDNFFASFTCVIYKAIQIWLCRHIEFWRPGGAANKHIKLVWFSEKDNFNPKNILKMVESFHLSGVLTDGFTIIKTLSNKNLYLLMSTVVNYVQNDCNRRFRVIWLSGSKKNKKIKKENKYLLPKILKEYFIFPIDLYLNIGVTWRVEMTLRYMFRVAPGQWTFCQLTTDDQLCHRLEHFNIYKIWSWFTL